MFRSLLAGFFFMLFPTIVAADITKETCWYDPNDPCVFIGLDPEKLAKEKVEAGFFPRADHYFRVVKIFALPPEEDMGDIYHDCFVQVTEHHMDTLSKFEFTLDSLIGEDGVPLVEDLDGAFIPVHTIDITTCLEEIQAAM